MNQYWQEVLLGEVLTFQRGYDLPMQERKPGTVPIISSSGISGTHSEARMTSPGVVTGRYGTIGEVFYVEQDYWPLNTTLFVKDFKGNDPRYVSYLLRTLDFQAYNDKSSVPGVNRNHLHLIKVSIPPLPEQRAIAHILGTLDDKIEVNRRMNATLEGIARALFRSWFVDFDPVRAKAEGREPEAMDAGTAALFPDAFVPSEGSSIPLHWKVGALGDIATNPRRGIAPGDFRPGTPYIGLEHMPRKSIALDNWGVVDNLVSGKFRFHRGEILFGKLRPYFHKVGVAPLDGVCSTDILVVVPKKPLWFAFLLGHSSSDELIQHTDSSSAGTRMPRASWSDLARFGVTLPPEPVAEAFDQQIRPLVLKIVANVHENKTLAELRDTLLPRLLSGELRVGDAAVPAEVSA